MPQMMINGQWQETPIGYNPIAPGTVQASQSNLPATGPGAQPGMGAWDSRNLTAQGMLDPRFQNNSTYAQNVAFGNMVGATTGQAPQYRGPTTGFGLAAQQYGAGTGPFAAPINLTNQNRALTQDGGIPAPPMTPGVGTQTPQAVTRQTPGATYQPPQAPQIQAPAPYSPPQTTRQTPGTPAGTQQNLGGYGNTPPSGYQMAQPPGLQQPPQQWTPTGPYTQNYAQGQQGNPWWSMAAPPYNPFQFGQGVSQGMGFPGQGMPFQGQNFMPPQQQMGGFPSNYGGGMGGQQQQGPQMQMPNLMNVLQQFQRPAMAPQGMGMGMGGGQQQMIQQLLRMLGMV